MSNISVERRDGKPNDSYTNVRWTTEVGSLVVISLDTRNKVAEYPHDVWANVKVID